VSDPVTLFRCRWLLAGPQSPLLPDAGVLVRAGRIDRVSTLRELTEVMPDNDVVELDGLVIPGLVDAHSHLRGLGLAEQDLFDTDLESWILRLQTATELDAGDEALVAAGDLLATGVTSVQGILHSYRDAASYRALIDEVAGAVTTTGIRAELMIGVTDQAEVMPPSLAPVPPRLAPYLDQPRRLTEAEFGSLVNAARAAWDRPGLRIGVAPVAAQWCSDALLAEVAMIAAAGIRLHTHLLESRHQRSWISESPVPRLRRHGLLTEQLSVAHCVWLNPAEMTELAAAGVSVVHCPSSNTGLVVGRARVDDWREARLPTALGLDSHPIDGRVDAFAELRAAATTADAIGRPLTPRQWFGRATVGGAAAIGRSGEIGQIASGYAADLVCIDAIDWPTGTDPWQWLLAEGSTERVRGVVSAGRMLVKDGELHCARAVEAARSRSVAHLRADATARDARQRSIEGAVVALHERLR
jgi:5-methylthioadenosine/S-adenosylhomocysteine deaminase